MFILIMQKKLSSFVDQKIILNQELFKVAEQQMKGLLHRSIVTITYMNRHHQLAIGNGVLISKNIVMAVAQNIYDKLAGCEYTHFKVYVGANGVTQTFYQVDGFRYMNEFKSCKPNDNIRFSIALLKLTKQVQFTEFLPISSICPQCLMLNNKGTSVQIFGYPALKDNYKPLDKDGISIQLNQYGLSRKNRIVNIDSSTNKICYRISTLQGQSGCPVVANKQIIAIHSGAGTGNQQFNIGTLIDLPILNILKNWCKQVNGHPFSSIHKDKCPHRGNTSNLTTQQVNSAQQSSQKEYCQVM